MAINYADHGVKEGKAVAALVYFADEVERERAIRWLEKLKDQGHVRGYVCEEYNPNWEAPAGTFHNFMSYLGNCTNESLIDELFGSVSNFAGLVEAQGDTFKHGRIVVRYNSKIDIHYFFIDFR